MISRNSLKATEATLNLEKFSKQSLNINGTSVASYAGLN